MTSGTRGTVLGPPRAHLLIPTHTTRHLGACVAALARQAMPPATVVVTCDTDDPAIPDLLRALWPRVAAVLAAKGLPVPTLLHVGRPHTGQARLNQVRNNGLRTVLSHGAQPHDLVVIIDGDMVLAPDAIAHHLELAHAGADVIVPFRVNLSEDQTARVSTDDLLAVHTPWPASLTGSDADLASLVERHRRYERQLRVRRLLPMLTKPHKPKLLGGHHAVRLAAMQAVNGYDEGYVGYGYDDDDLARRLHKQPGLRWRIAVRDILAFHLWHPTRAPARPTDAPGHARFVARRDALRAEPGLDAPADQPPPVVTTVPA